MTAPKLLPIRVEIRTSDIPDADMRDPMLYEKWLIHALQEGGIPARAIFGYGELSRLDDPTDFGKTIYEWRPSRVE